MTPYDTPPHPICDRSLLHPLVGCSFMWSRSNYTSFLFSFYLHLYCAAWTIVSASSIPWWAVLSCEPDLINIIFVLHSLFLRSVNYCFLHVQFAYSIYHQRQCLCFNRIVYSGLSSHGQVFQTIRWFWTCRGLMGRCGQDHWGGSHAWCLKRRISNVGRLLKEFLLGGTLVRCR